MSLTLSSLRSAAGCLALLVVSSLAISACEQKPAEPEQVEDPCPKIALDKLAGDWIRVMGKRGVHQDRFRILGTVDAYEAHLIPGFFTKLHMKGTTRQEKGDVVFEQQLSPEHQKEFETGYRVKYRLYVEPYKRSCSLRVVLAQVQRKEDGKESEQPRTGGYEEFLPFPDDVEFTYTPPDGPLFLAQAAKNRGAAQAQLKQYGQPKPDTDFGEAIPVGFFSEATADGSPDCSYDMDLYFDDKPYTGHRDHPSDAAGKAVPAGEVKGGYRHWYSEWYAPYGGNHNFEMYRYRTCGGKRELLSIQGIEAILG